MILKNFFVLEGVDGAGTTTQAGMLAKFFSDSVFQCEPTAGKIGVLIREILSGKTAIDKLTLAHLFASDRSDHVYNPNGIIELAKQNKIFCDRYILSSFAYQTLDIEARTVERLNGDFPIPEKTFFIDTPVDISMSRIVSRDSREIYEHKALQIKVRENYLRAIEIYRAKGWEIEIIDGRGSIEEIFEFIKGEVAKR